LDIVASKQLNMKKLALIALMAGSFLRHSASAQVKVDLNVNIGSQPLWGPTGYDHAEYYYLPEYDVYYDVPHRQYIYWNNGRRVTAATLPARYHADLYHTYKVVKNEPRPWGHHNDDVKKYAEYKSHHDQGPIRDSHEEKYWQIKGHPDHSKWKGNQGHDRGHH